ncbi:MAG TPA: FUSC family protein, partial [Burkholderiaceae bacterium]|nr:FUSC family protein [Burkholderiaceae bacterium]
SSRGLLLERGFFRIVGTLVGAAAGFGLMHIPAGPYVVLALLGVWIALTSGLTHLLRGMHYYGALMAGMTAAIVVLPSIWTPDAALAIAAARVECTLIGVVVVTLVTGFLTPEAQRQKFYQRVRKVSGDALAHVAELLRGSDNERNAEVERRILSGLSKLENAAPLVAAGSVEGYRRLRHVDTLVVASLSAIAEGAALRGRLQAGAADGINVPADLPARLQQLADHLRTAPSVAAQEMPALPLQMDAKGLNRLKRALQQLLGSAAALCSPNGNADSRPLGAAPERLAPHREWVLARRTGLVSGVVSFVASALGYWSGWPAAELAALGVCIFSTVLGSMAMPQKVAPSLLKGILVGVAVATLYRFLLQPYITTLPELLLSVAPFILIGGFARASKRFAIPAIDYNMGFLLASQAVLPAVTDPAAIWGNAFALIGVAFLVAGSFILLPRSPERQAMEAAETVRRDLRRLIERSGPGGDWHAQTTRQILRLTLHLGRAGELGMRLPAGMLAVLNLGYAIGDLRQAAQRAPSDAAVQRLVSEALELLMTCASVPELTVARLRALMANVEDPALTEIMKNMTVALIEGSALLTFGLAAKRSVD